MTDKVEDKPIDAPVEDAVVEDAAPVDVSPEEQRAQEFGWLPKEKWVEDGKSEDDWVPAKHFLKFGEVKKELIAREKLLSKQQKVMAKMKEHHLAVRERAMQEALIQLKRERNQALEDGDMITAEKLRDRLEETKDRFAKMPTMPPDIEQELRQPTNVNDPPPEFHTFAARNPWYESNPDKQDELSQEADTYAHAYVQRRVLKGETVTPKEVYDVVEKYVRKAHPEKFGTPKSPVGDPPSRSGSSRTTGEHGLTAQELEVAKQFNLTPQQYAKELKSYKGK